MLKARQRLGKYRIVRRVAEGGFSSVYDAYDTIENLHVAHRRGFCMVLGAGQTCPHDAEGYLDACEMINMGLIDPPG